MLTQQNPDLFCIANKEGFWDSQGMSAKYQRHLLATG